MNFDAFFSDARLAQLTEKLKIADDILEIISLGENQNSDLLAWMFDSREGHGQGDEILKDLLLTASVCANVTGSHLDGRSETALFFKDWTPGRIRTASFGASFIVRELGLPSGNRLDLFIVDPQNRFLIVVENKKGGFLGEIQLDDYNAAVRDATRDHPTLREYRRVFLAIKKDLEYLEETEQQPSPYWLALDYEWLDHAAKRAAHQVSRGNAAAGLVMSYCQQVTGWESPVDREATELAASLSLDHEDVVGKLVKLRPRPEKKWIADASAHQLPEEVWLFALQNRSLLDKLAKIHGYAAIKRMLLNAMPGFPSDSVEHMRAWLNLCPRGAEKFFDAWWAAFLSIHGGADNKFHLNFCWNANNLPSGIDPRPIRAAITGVVPELKKWPDSRWRRIRLKSALDKIALAKAVVVYEQKLSDVFKSPAMQAIADAI